MKSYKKIPTARPQTLKRFATIHGLPFESINDKKRVTSGWAMKYLKDISIDNSTFKKGTILLNIKGLKSDLSHHHKPLEKKLYSFTALTEIIATAKYQGEKPDTKGRKNVRVHCFTSHVIVENELFDVVIFVYETNKVYVYDHLLLTKILSLK
jgi:hypothetical protein